jgi:hypothetical protein
MSLDTVLVIALVYIAGLNGMFVIRGFLTSETYRVTQDPEASLQKLLNIWGSKAVIIPALLWPFYIVNTFKQVRDFDDIRQEPLSLNK